MKPVGQIIIFFALNIFVSQFNLCKAGVDPTEWTDFASFISLKHSPLYNESTEIENRILTLEEIALNEISRIEQPPVNVNKPDEALVDIKTAIVKRIEELNSEFGRNGNQWGPVCDNFYSFAKGECAKIARLTAAGKLKPNRALNVFARKLIVVLEHTCRVLAQFKFQRKSTEAELVAVPLPAFDPLVD